MNRSQTVRFDRISAALRHRPPNPDEPKRD
jgi:hypothetical protein